MSCKYLFNGLFVFLVESMFFIVFNIGGQISVAEIVLFLWFFLFYKKMKNVEYYKKIRCLYFVLLGTQIFSELFVSNGLNDSFRGIMVTVVSFLHITFLLFYANKNHSLLLFAILGRMISILFDNSMEDVSLDVIEEGAAAAYVKMKIAPVIGYLLVFFSVFVNKKIAVAIFSFIGFLLIVLGARSGGMFIVVSGILGFYLLSSKRINIKRKIPGLIFSLLILYVGYCYYATAVLEGNINSGNNEQILMMKNPYNPLELLYVGRGEFFVGIQAFIDRFWLGFGAWAKDTTGHYWDLLHDMKNLDSNGWHGVWLPVHSVLIGWGVYNGILCFVAGLRIVVFTLKKTFSFIKLNLYDSKYMFCISYCLVSFLWNLLFSPPSHFRYSIPIMMACLLTLKRKKYDC